MKKTTYRILLAASFIFLFASIAAAIISSDLALTLIAVFSAISWTLVIIAASTIQTEK